MRQRRRGGMVVLLATLAVAAPAPAAASLVSENDRGRTVVCAPVTCEVAALRLAAGDRLVLRAGVHRGPLDVRNVTGLTVVGDPGAVVDAGRSRYALSLRDVRDVRVSGLVLRGGTAQTVWVDRATRVVLTSVRVEGGRGSGVQVRDTSGLTLSASSVSGAAAAGVMELTGVRGSVYERLLVTRNGRGAAAYDGDGLQLSGSGVTVRDVTVTDNGSSARYEHGVYVSSRARDVRIRGLVSRGNAGVALKLGGSGRLEQSTLVDERMALYCAETAGAGWSVRTTSLRAPTAATRGPGCRWSTDQSGGSASS